MHFWKRLRWAATAAFVALLTVSALLVDTPGGAPADSSPARPVPIIIR